LKKEEGRSKKEEGRFIYVDSDRSDFGVSAHTKAPDQNSALLGLGRKLLPSSFFLLPSLIKYLARRFFYVYY
jgi:hypothetical protein